MMDHSCLFDFADPQLLNSSLLFLTVFQQNVITIYLVFRVHSMWRSDFLLPVIINICDGPTRRPFCNGAWKLERAPAGIWMSRMQ